MYLDNSFEFIVITSNDTLRNENMKKQFELLDENVNICYLDAIMPSNSKEYFENMSYDIMNDKNLIKIHCCFRSHLKALEYASKSKYKFSIILEDDIAFYKKNFLETLNDILNKWEEYTPHKMVSIGWIPIDNYLSIEEKYKNNYKVNNDVFKLLNIVVSGFQGYIVKNDDIPYLDYLIQPTLIEMYNKLNSEEFKQIIKSHGSYEMYINEYKYDYPIDRYLNFLYKQLVIFPPLLIENNLPSLLDHDNNYYWNIFFENCEFIKNNYNLN